ncbi:hypothetical protein, partial [Blautia wexlerae]|uniref:hypothetical protein n=1 Tax=Blautia wexlerae TaxID=418240 RepID=UPI0034A1DC37
HRNDTETRQSDRGIVYPIADTSGDFKRLYGCNFAENRPRNHTLKREETQYAENEQKEEA